MNDGELQNMNEFALKELERYNPDLIIENTKENVPDQLLEKIQPFLKEKGSA